MPAPTLAAHRAALETMLAMNARADVQHVTRLILDGLDAEARRYLLLIERHVKAPTSGYRWSTLGLFGENGHAPAIRDICRQGEYFRALARRAAA